MAEDIWTTADEAELRKLEHKPPFRPLLDRVLIRRIEPEAAPDGFSVPEKYRQHSNLGTVIALGDGIALGGKWRPLTDFISLGSVCMYGEYTAECLELDGEQLWIVRLQDIRGVKIA
jgi:co-chaperonin GroES (HSP10)